MNGNVGDDYYLHDHCRVFHNASTWSKLLKWWRCIQTSCAPIEARGRENENDRNKKLAKAIDSAFGENQLIPIELSNIVRRLFGLFALKCISHRYRDGNIVITLAHVVMDRPFSLLAHRRSILLDRKNSNLAFWHDPYWCALSSVLPNRLSTVGIYWFEIRSAIVLSALEYAYLSYESLVLYAFSFCKRSHAHPPIHRHSHFGSLFVPIQNQ